MFWAVRYAEGDYSEEGLEVGRLASKWLADRLLRSAVVSWSEAVIIRLCVEWLIYLLSWLYASIPCGFLLIQALYSTPWCPPLFQWCLPCSIDSHIPHTNYNNAQRIRTLLLQVISLTCYRYTIRPIRRMKIWCLDRLEGIWWVRRIWWCGVSEAGELHVWRHAKDLNNRCCYHLLRRKWTYNEIDCLID